MAQRIDRDPAAVAKQKAHHAWMKGLFENKESLKENQTPNIHTAHDEDNKALQPTLKQQKEAVLPTLKQQTEAEQQRRVELAKREILDRLDGYDTTSGGIRWRRRGAIDETCTANELKVDDDISAQQATVAPPSLEPRSDSPTAVPSTDPPMPPSLSAMPSTDFDDEFKFEPHPYTWSSAPPQTTREAADAHHARNWVWYSNPETQVAQDDADLAWVRSNAVWTNRMTGQRAPYVSQAVHDKLNRAAAQYNVHGSCAMIPRLNGSADHEGVRRCRNEQAERTAREERRERERKQQAGHNPYYGPEAAKEHWQYCARCDEAKQTCQVCQDAVSGLKARIQNAYVKVSTMQATTRKLKATLKGLRECQDAKVRASNEEKVSALQKILDDHEAEMPAVEKAAKRQIELAERDLQFYGAVYEAPDQKGSDKNTDDVPDSEVIVKRGDLELQRGQGLGLSYERRFAVIRRDGIVGMFKTEQHFLRDGQTPIESFQLQGGETLLLPKNYKEHYYHQLVIAAGHEREQRWTLGFESEKSRADWERVLRDLLERRSNQAKQQQDEEISAMQRRLIKSAQEQGPFEPGFNPLYGQRAAGQNQSNQAKQQQDEESLLSPAHRRPKDSARVKGPCPYNPYYYGFDPSRIEREKETQATKPDSAKVRATPSTRNGM